MGYAVRPDPVLISREYWGGIDLDDPINFVGEASPHLHLNQAQHLYAAGLLADTLHKAMLGQASERPQSEREMLANIAISTSPIVMVINTEFLLRWDPHRLQDRRLIEDSLVEAHADWPAIQRPFTKYWTANQSIDPTVDNTHFGEEHAAFPEDSSFYYHSLQWAVLLRREEDNMPVLDTWVLRDPRFMSDGKILVPHKGQRTKGLPLAVGDIVPDQPYSKINSPRSLHRIIDLTAVEITPGHGYDIGEPVGRQLVLQH